MLKRSRFIYFFIVVLLSISFQCSIVSGASPAYLCIKITDAQTSPLQPIENVTILLWDLSTLEKPTLGRGIYFTDDNGECNITGSYIVQGHDYRLYAFKGNFSRATIEYTPVRPYLYFTFPRDQSFMNLSLSLIPGALIIIEGNIYSVDPNGLETTRFKIIINSPSELNKTSYLNEWGKNYDSWWFLGSNPRYVAVPANVPINLKVETTFSTRKGNKQFALNIEDVGGKPFNITKGSIRILNLSEYSAEDSLRKMQNRYSYVTGLVGDARNIGFMVFEEDSSLRKVELEINEDARRFINELKYEDAWMTLRKAYSEMDFIIGNLNNMRLISTSSAVYLPTVISIFSIILAFFLFENNRRKIISSVVIYAIFLVIFYMIYPGITLLINENFTLFLMTAFISFIIATAVIFGIPRVWKERQLEGEVSLRSSISIIFSMGKRQIKRKKIRSFFTIFSMVLLILAFTSLTSFGAVYGVVSKSVSGSPSSEAILVNRLLNETAISHTPLDFSDLDRLSNIIKIRNVSPRVYNLPASNPLATLENPLTKDHISLYGILGIDPANETIFKNNLIISGAFLDEEEKNEILISANLANALHIDVNKNVNLYISGVSSFGANFTVKGLYNDAQYMSLTDIDGQLFGPLRYLPDSSLRVCNSTEVIVMNWQTVISLQQEVNVLGGVSAPKFALLSSIVFQPMTWSESEIKSMINTLVLALEYDVFVFYRNEILHYLIGSYVETKGVLELMFPLVMAGLNVGAVMLNAVYERRREIRVLSMIGLNPVHIATTFVAEAIVVGMVGGSIGYLFGLGFYRIMALFSSGLMVREKLEWWWSAIAFTLSISASVLSAIRPATLAVSMYTPSKVRKLKMTEREKEVRKETLFKAFQARELSMPVKVKVNEIPFFFNLVLDHLKELSTGILETTEEVEEQPETENVKGELIRIIKFNYIITVEGEKRGTRNELIGQKSPNEDYYRIKLVSTPYSPGTPITMIDRTIDFIHDLVMKWNRDKKRIISNL